MKNNRTFLEKLLDGAEVEWKTLDEISSIYGGLTGKGKADFENGNALYVPYKNIFNNIEVDFNNLDTVNVSDDEKQYAIKYGDVLFTGSSETAEEAGMSSAVTTKTEQKIYLNSFSFGLRFNDDVELLPEFSKFLFRTLSIRKEIVKSASGVTRFNISKARFKKIKIPIPPLSVQTEIVRILDALTALTSELISELILRQKQYEYYREKLLSEEELGKVGFEWKTLGDVAKIQRGASPRPISQYITDDPNGIPWIKIGDTSLDSKYIENTAQKITIEGAEKSRILKSGDFVMSNSMSYGRPYILKISGAIHDGWASISNFGNILNSDFLYYYLSSNTVQSYWNGKINSSSVSNLNSDIIKSLSIPIPTLNIQIEIAKTLDKFETLTNSITKGLPLAIEQSQKRYEYYRELLLNFPGRE